MAKNPPLLQNRDGGTLTHVSMVTMTDIARKAGVSRATVSLVLNGKDAAVGIAEETRRRVRAAAEELGYRPNQVARAMVTGRNQVLVFLVPTPSAEVASRILEGVLREAEEVGYFVKVLPFSGPVSHRVIERCVELRPTGVVALYLYGEALNYLYNELTRYRIPAVIVDSSPQMDRGIRVFSDDQDGMRQVLTHLTELGHRRIAFIGGTEASGAAQLRETAYKELLAEWDLPQPEGYLQRGRFNIEATEQAARTLLAHPERPTAIACVDDRTAMIVERVAWGSGVRVPEELSVTGFADLVMAEYSHPALTTVVQPFEAMGRSAVRHLLSVDLSEGVNVSMIEEPLPTELKVRASTAPVPSTE